MVLTKKIKSTIISGSMDNVVLNFTILDEYENVMSQIEGTPIESHPVGFKSLSEVVSDLEQIRETDSTGEIYLNLPNIADTIYQDYGRLLDVLNKDKIVELNGYLVKVDLQKDSVFTINAEVENAYGILSNNEVNDSIKVYPTNIEVGLMLFKINIFTCKDPWAQSNKDNQKDAKCSNNYKTNKKVVYQTAGIYFSLVAKGENLQKRWYTFGIWYNWDGIEPLLYMNMYFKQRCGTEWAWWQGNAQSWYHANIAYTGNAHKSVFRPYNGTKALTKYYFSSSIHGSCGVDYLKIEDNM